MERKSYPSLDVGKLLCALLILFYHYFSEVGGAPALLEEALSLYAVAVTLFMTVSGFLTFRKLSDRENRWGYVKKQVKRIFVIYLLWSVPYLVFTISRWDFSGLTPEFLFWTVQGWVFGSTFYTIWFLPSLAIGTLLAFWVSERLPQKTGIALAVVCYLLGALTGTYRALGGMIPGFSEFQAFSGLWLGGSRGGLLFGFPLVLLGKGAVKENHRFGWLGWGVLSVVFMGALLGEALLLRHFLGNTGIDNTLMMIPTVVCILQFLLHISLPEGGYVPFMRKLSVLIFVSQRLFLSVLSVLVPAVAEYVVSHLWIGAVLLCGGTILFSAGMILLSEKLPWLKKLY